MVSMVLVLVFYWIRFWCFSCLVDLLIVLLIIRILFVVLRWVCLLVVVFLVWSAVGCLLCMLYFGVVNLLLWFGLKIVFGC